MQKLLSGALFVHGLNNPNAWKISFSYPLLASVNTERADEMIVAHMANGAREQCLLRLDMGQFVSFLEQDNSDTFTDIAFLSYSPGEEKMLLYVLSLENSFKKGAVLR